MRKRISGEGDEQALHQLMPLVERELNRTTARRNCRKFLASGGFFPLAARSALSAAIRALHGPGTSRALFAVDEQPTAMQLPFTKEQFFDLFAAYNGALWPAVIALWTASAIVALRLSVRRPHDRWVSALLAWHWAWSGVAYQVAFFTRINPAAWLFAALFLAQAILFFRVGVVQRRLSFAPWGSAWAPLAWGLIVYSLAYPAINALDHRSLVRIPTFGLPCPTTLFTVGVLMLATSRCWSLALVPVIWSAIGGSAAILLGVYTDIALPIAGMALVISSVRRGTHRSSDVCPGSTC